MTVIVFIIGFISAILLLALALASILVPRLRFFPPPARESWQDRLFWLLFRLMFYALVFVCVLDFRGLGEVPAWLALVGWSLLFSGFGMAFRITVQLGWRDAH